METSFGELLNSESIFIGWSVFDGGLMLQIGGQVWCVEKELKH